MAASAPLKKYASWRFFDKKGKSLNFTYDEELERWTGEMFFNEVSTGLIENEHLYVLERFLEQSQRDLFLPESILEVPEGYGKFIFSITPPEEFDDNTKFVWKDCEGNTILFYRKDYSSNDEWFEGILAGIRGILGYELSMRSGNQFTIIVNLDQQPCIDTSTENIGTTPCD